MILTPYGYVPGQFPSEAQAIGPSGSYSCPHDPQHNVTGEDGFYADSHLGGASGPQLIAQGPTPSDFQHARAYQYTPSVRGWVPTSAGYVQGSYYPQSPAGARYPASALGDAAEVAAAAAASATSYATPAQTAAEREEARRKNITYWISVGTAITVGGSALLAIFRTVRGLRHDQMIRDALAKKLL